MRCRVSELRYKEIIDVADGSRYGFVGDVEVDLETGQITQLIVPGRLPLVLRAPLRGGYHPGGTGPAPSGTPPGIGKISPVPPLCNL